MLAALSRRDVNLQLLAEASNLKKMFLKKKKSNLWSSLAKPLLAGADRRFNFFSTTVSALMWPLPWSLTHFTLRWEPAGPRAMWQHFCCNCSALSHPLQHFIISKPTSSNNLSARLSQLWPLMWTPPVLRSCSLANDQRFSAGAGGVKKVASLFIYFFYFSAD